MARKTVSRMLDARVCYVTRERIRQSPIMLHPVRRPCATIWSPLWSFKHFEEKIENTVLIKCASGMAPSFSSLLQVTIIGRNVPKRRRPPSRLR